MNFSERQRRDFDAMNRALTEDPPCADGPLDPSQTYGVNETNPMPAGYHDEEPNSWVEWNDARLEKVIRLRLLSDPGFPVWDVSYCHGRLDDGTKVGVILPFDQLSKRKSLKAQIIRYAQKDRVYAKGLGILDAISTLN